MGASLLLQSCQHWNDGIIGDRVNKVSIASIFHDDHNKLSEYVGITNNIAYCVRIDLVVSAFCGFVLLCLKDRGIKEYTQCTVTALVGSWDKGIYTMYGYCA